MDMVFDFSMPDKKRRWRVKYNGEFVNAMDGTVLEFNFAAEAVGYVDQICERVHTQRSCFEVVPVVK